jgi:hypothetical protein
MNGHGSRCYCAMCHERRHELATLDALLEAKHIRSPLVRILVETENRHRVYGPAKPKGWRKQHPPKPVPPSRAHQCDLCEWATDNPEYLTVHRLYKHERRAS